MTANYVLLGAQTVGNGGAASVTFANIPQSGYTDLKIVLSARCDAAAVQQTVVMKVGSLTSGYSDKYLYGSGSATGSGSLGTTIAFVGDAPAANATANTFGSQEVYIPNYLSTNPKSWSVDSVAETNATAAYMELTAGYNSNTSAISQLMFYPSSGNFVAGSTFYLYGLAAVGTTPVLAPFASGGDVIANDGTYWYHAFKTTGAFVPAKALSADVLVVAGGGGGGGNNTSWGSGGGGAGGFLGFTSQSFALNTSYTCTVGAGGATNTSGTNSSVTGLTAAVGGGFGGRSTGTSGTAGGGTGGSGGGGAYQSGAAGTASPSGQGNAGGSGNATNGNGAGGGGAGAVGSNAAGGTQDGANGGAGLNTYSTWATATATGASGYYAGGGGGGGNGSVGGSGGAGGAGAGSGTSTGTAATANTGSGGGGGFATNSGGAGGSGIVIIRYAMA